MSRLSHAQGLWTPWRLHSGAQSLRSSGKETSSEKGPVKGLPITSAKYKCHGFPSDLKDVVLGGGVNAQMKHGLSGHLETIL